MLSFSKNIYAVDFGSDAAKIYSLRRDRITTEKNMIAILGGQQVIAVGNQAYEMLEKNPPGIDVRSPVTDGTIADTDRGGFVLKKLLMRADAHPGYGPKMYFAAPPDLSYIEKRAYVDIGADAGIRQNNLFLVDQPICDAIRAGISLEKTRGSMIVNIGAEVTRISVIAGGQIVRSGMFLTGGRAVDQAVADHVRRRTNVLIGGRTANRLKHAMADFADRDDARKTIGMDTLSGVPKEVIVSARLIREASEEVLSGIAKEVRGQLEKIPPQISGFIRAEGVYLTGGCSGIGNISDYFQEKTGARINLLTDGELSTIHGLREIIMHKSLMKYAYSISDFRKKK